MLANGKSWKRNKIIHKIILWGEKDYCQLGEIREIDGVGKEAFKPDPEYKQKMKNVNEI